MTARAEIVARILDRVQFVTGAAPQTIATDKPLLGQAQIDSLDVFELEFELEGEFGLSAALDLKPDSTVDSIADAVIAAKGA